MHAMGRKYATLEELRMPDTRRTFLQTTATLAASLAGAGGAASAQAPAAQGPGPRDPFASAVASVPDADIKVPKVKFGKVEISRMIVGTNQFYGFAHYNSILSALMKDWYTPAKVVEVLQRCEKYGLNAFNYWHIGRSQTDWERYLAQGGKMHIVAQATTPDPATLVNAVKPMAAYAQGDKTDNAFQNDQLDTIRDYCKKLRDLGVPMVGVGSHIPEVLSIVEDQGWDVDFYAGCVYNRRRTPDELRKLMGGELPELPGEVYLQDDPPRMYKFFRQTKKPCVAFKILSAGRVVSPEAAFKQAFQSIKPTDLVLVGMFPRFKDEVKENAYFTSRYGC
jgi:hypothetical protein